jgi:predicted AAA+ superfamily ATPase
MLDLLRRADFYTLHPMNYAEYLTFFHSITVPTVSFSELLEHHQDIALQYGDLHRERYFTEFLQKGQYPYTQSLEGENFVEKFQTLFDKVVIEDLPVFLNMQTTSLDKLRRLLYFISNTLPSELSFYGLAKKISIDKTIVENALTLLSKI